MASQWIALIRRSRTTKTAAVVGRFKPWTPVEHERRFAYLTEDLWQRFQSNSPFRGFFSPQWPRLATESALSSAAAHGAAVSPGERVAAALAEAASATASRAVATAGGLSSATKAAASAIEAAAERFGISILYKQKRMFRGVHGTLNPSLWRWYHRHGYWATRRKNIDFGTKRPHRYHQVVGDGKRGARYARKFASWWVDKSYYRPMKNYCRF
eukprot:TRINITY_DN27285_c0_g1_i1.p1 TRINITY_DN27285_c0_g1~~TRINITY_DN27285_c0_g1_i1.p1  ORF type:complete len:232 (+),score=26.23 TRINITY_DN27285_c0_g1_i1:60-698(+)